MDRVPDFGSGCGGSSPSGRASLLFGPGRWLLAALLALAPAPPALADSAQLHNTTGLAFYYQGKYVQAFREFVAALKRDPTFAAPHFNLARVYEKQGRFEEAREQYRQTLQLDPTHLGAKGALQRLGTQAVRPPPDAEPEVPAEVLDLGAQKTKVKRWIAAGELDQAEKRLYRLLKARGRDAELHDLLARVFERRNRYDAALAESQKAALYNPSSATLRYRHGANLFRLGQFEEAAKEAARAAELAPNDFRVYYLLGLIYQRLDKLDQAFVNFEEAARINPDDQAVRQHLTKLADHLGLYNYNSGLYHFAQKNWVEAKKHLELALRKGNLNDEQRAIAQQYLIVADFSAQDIANQIRDLQASRRNEQRGFVAKRLTFEEVERSPTIWRQGHYVDFRGRVVKINRNRKEILVETDEDADIRSTSDLRTWFKVILPEPLPDDPRIRNESRIENRRGQRDGTFIRVEGQLQRPAFLQNPWNRTLGSEPQPVVKATFVVFRAEDNLAGDLRIDYLQFNKARAKVDNPGPATPLFPTVGSPIPIPLPGP